MKLLPKDVVILNDNRYKISITMLNTKGAITLPLGLVKSVIIYDNLYSIFCSAKLIIDNSSNTLENFSSDVQNELKEHVQSSSYAFNSDNNDSLIFELVPITEHGEDDVAFPPAIHKLKYLFSIYNEEEYGASESNDKSKVFYLRDRRAQEFQQSNIQWSTSNVVSKKYKHKVNTSLLSNKLRSVQTGEALKDLIQTTLQPDYKVAFEKNWDKGATDIFHTSTTQSSVFDDVEHILDNHLSFNNRDNCILRFNQRTEKWSLKSFNQMYIDAIDESSNTFGSGVIDAFSIHGTSMANTGKEKATKKPKTEFGGYSQVTESMDGLTSYEYLNVANDDSINEIVSHIVHNYNCSDKQFNLDCQSGYITNVENEFQSLYADHMAGAEPTAIFPNNEDKKQNLIRHNTYNNSNGKVHRLTSGRNKVLSKALAYSPGLSFTVNGATHRDSGKFVLVCGEDADSGKSFAKVLYGEWLITNIVHMFMFDQEEYKNAITCVKPHSYGPIK
jgi:hypothetical protein